MTMYVVAGDGEMARKELTATLDEMQAQAVAEDRTFWLLVRAHAEPSATEKAMLGWLDSNECYFEVYGDDIKGADKIYAGAQDKHEVKRLTPKIISLMDEKPEDGEDALLLALFASDDPDAEEDRWLNELVTAVIEKGNKVLALNDGLTEVGVEEVPEGAEAEEEAVEADGSAEDPEPAVGSWTREALEALELPDLKKIATDLGIDVPSRSRMPTYISLILEHGAKDTPAEVEVDDAVTPESPKPPRSSAGATTSTNASANGHVDLPALAKALVDEVIDRFKSLLG